MGGLESEVSEKTTRLAIEAAHFISESIARQSRSHQLSTEASRRFERGVDPALAELASARAVELLIKYGGASYHGFSTQGSLPPNKKVVIRPEQVSILIGANYTPTEITKALSGIGCQIKRSTKLWTWGANDTGQLGIGDTTSRSSPVQIGTNTNWRSISCGSAHSFGIKTDGSLWGWGKNSSGAANGRWVS